MTAGVEPWHGVAARVAGGNVKSWRNWRIVVDHDVRCYRMAAS